MSPAKQKRADDRRIELAYRGRCSGITIPMQGIASVFAVGRAGIAQGMTDDQLAELIYAHVQTIKVSP